MRVWDADTGSVFWLGNADASGVLCLAWSPDGRTIACGTDDGSVVIWDAANGDLIHRGRHDRGSVHAVAWSPDGALLASVSNAGIVLVLDVANGSIPPFPVLRSDKELYALAWSPRGALLASSGLDGVIRLWERGGDETEVLLGHSAAVTDLAFSADGAFLASISWDNTVRVWNVQERREITMLEVASSSRFHSESPSVR